VRRYKLDVDTNRRRSQGYSDPRKCHLLGDQKTPRRAWLGATYSGHETRSSMAEDSDASTKVLKISRCLARGSRSVCQEGIAMIGNGWLMTTLFACPTDDFTCKGRMEGGHENQNNVHCKASNGFDTTT